MTKMVLNSSVYERLADLCHEVGFLRRIQRTGYAFLGSGKENVAEHSYRMSIIGYILANMANANASHVVLLCLFHDLHEVRTGDFNYVNHRYNSCDARKALIDATNGSGLSENILSLFDEFEAKESLEAKLARDADQLDLIGNLQVEMEMGNGFAKDWIDSALQRLVTEQGKTLAENMLLRNVNDFWYRQIPKSWWINKGENL